ncbi:MAG: tetratricopeptide repeat protein, partial [Rhodanobacteraceae bacterium]
VLPFENLSGEKNSKYFTDGMQDLILTKLADIGDLKVIARTSTERYSSHPADLKTIGRQLGVATILEGSVQKAGNQVLINVQLIDADTDAHIWAEAYTRSLSNIFGVEGEVAQKVADALNAKLTAVEAARVANAPTTNAAALDAFLRGEYDMANFNRGLVKADVTNAVRNYSEAVKQDPRFALAWARLANAQVFMHGMTNDNPALVAQYVSAAKTSIAHALALQPDLAEAYVSQGIYDIFVSGNLDDALRAFARAHTLQPQNERAMWFTGYTFAAQGKPQEAGRAYRRAQVLDPRRPPIQLAGIEWDLRHFAEAERLLKRALAIDPTSWVATDSLAGLYAFTGHLDRMGALLASVPESVKANPNFVDTLGTYLTYRRDWPAARKLYAQAKEPQNLHAAYFPIETLRGNVEWYAGDHAAALAQYRLALSLVEAQLKSHPDSRRWHGELAWLYARIGHDQEALQQAEIVAHGRRDPKTGVVRGAPYIGRMLALIEAQIGKPGKAIAQLDELLAAPTGSAISVPLLKLEPAWDPIRNDPRFKALLKKYEDTAPAAASSGAGDD